MSAGVTVAIAGLTVAIAGYGSSGSDDPEDVVENYFNAIDDGDMDEMESLVHSDSPIQDGFAEDNELNKGFLEGLDITVEDTELVEEDDDTAIVEAETTVVFFGEEVTEVSEVELRTEDGDWRIWDEE